MLTFASLNQEFINFLETAAEQEVGAQKFYNIHKFSYCLGAIDCTDIRLQSTGGHEPETFWNWKGWFSINV